MQFKFGGTFRLDLPNTSPKNLKTYWWINSLVDTNNGLFKMRFLSFYSYYHSYVSSQHFDKTFTRCPGKFLTSWPCYTVTSFEIKLACFQTSDSLSCTCLQKRWPYLTHNSLTLLQSFCHCYNWIFYVKIWYKICSCFFDLSKISLTLLLLFLVQTIFCGVSCSLLSFV